MNTLTGKDFKALLESAHNNLINHHKEIDALNVFPVPDGDTGTNMNLTFSSGVTEALALKTDDISAIAKTLSRGLLMGARGNSGVILSQIFRGFSQSLDGRTSIDAAGLGQAFLKGSEVAYKAVMRPVEGTILTVIREAAWYANDYVEKHPGAAVEEYIDILVKESEESLRRTPDLLPVLKEVGVLDSGGAGLVEILKGFQAALAGHPVELKSEADEPEKPAKKEIGYRTEFWLELNDLSKNDPSVEDTLRQRLSQIGEELVLYLNKGVIEVSIKTLMPGQAMNFAQRYGVFTKLQIDNLALPYGESIISQPKELPHTKYAIIAVASGSGLGTMFKDLGADLIVSGGQTMNPSTEDFVSAIQKTNADHVIILPNNGNIILAAQQTKAVRDDLDIRVIETKSIPQGLSALIAFDVELEAAANIANMTAAAKHVITGQVTYAIKDSQIDGLAIKAHDYMGILEKNIVTSGPELLGSTKKLIDLMLKDRQDDYSVVTLISGEGVDETSRNLIADYITKSYPYEVESYDGKQAVYSFIIGLD